VKRVPEGVVFRLEREGWNLDLHSEIAEIIILEKGWGDTTTFECELSVRQREEQKLPSLFRESVLKSFNY
jgi:hypothetical protein